MRGASRRLRGADANLRPPGRGACARQEVRVGGISVDEPSNRSAGYLPISVLKHDDPTAVGMWDLDSPQGVARPAGADLPEARDQLVLARLHGEPLAILHIDERPGAEDRSRLMSAVWSEAQSEILRHLQSCECLPTPGDAEQLGQALAASDGRCPGLVPTRPPGQAAVIVCTIGRKDVLLRTLRSLARMQCDDFEIVVVDNRPDSADTLTLVEDFESPVPVRYVAESRPGLSAARNAGIAATADAAYVAFVDDDVVADTRWLAWLLAPFARPEVQAVTGLVMPLSLESAVEKRFEQYAGFGKGVAGKTYDLAEHRSDRFLYPYWGGVFGSGNSMAFRREVVLALGGFDLALGAGTSVAAGEDIAMFTDVILAGGSIVYEPHSLCWHEHRSDEVSLQTQVRGYGIGMTAVFWRYLWTDWRFTLEMLRSIPLMVRLMRQRSNDQQGQDLPADLVQIESRGRWVGPWRYLVGRRKLKRN
jgi:GT2 family glycosyltransferase